MAHPMTSWEERPRTPAEREADLRWARRSVGLRAFARLLGARITGGRSADALRILIWLGLDRAQAWTLIESWPEGALRRALALGWHEGEYLAVFLIERLPGQLSGGLTVRGVDWPRALGSAMRMTDAGVEPGELT